METLLVLAVVVLLVGIGVVTHHALRYKRRYHQLVGVAHRGPIPTVSLAEFHPAFANDEFGPTERSEVHFVGQGGAVAFGTTDAEAWILAVLAKECRNMFEFGTGTGKTAYLWAKNSRPEARVTTLTLAPDQQHLYQPEAGDSGSSRRSALMESSFSRFRYSGTDVEAKVTQYFGDSKDFDETPYLAQCDLIFVDGSHAYSYVKSDTAKALRMLKKGGIIVWHDYKSWDPSVRGVFKFLNELNLRLPLAHLRGTSLVAYRAEDHERQVRALSIGGKPAGGTGA